jgi:hypothetical protein
MLYGPGSLGLLILFFACLFSRRWLWLVAACTVSLILQLVSFAFIYFIAGMGSGGNNYALDFPWKILCGGIAATAFLTLIKSLHLSNLDK